MGGHWEIKISKEKFIELEEKELEENQLLKAKSLF